MNGTFTTCGKQVLLNGADFAQAQTPESAQQIAAAMQRWAPSLHHDALALSLRAGAVLHTEMVATLNDPAQRPLRKTLLDLAKAMLEAAKVLSNG